MPPMPKGREDPKLSLAAEMLRRHGTVRLKAWGTSMLPSVWPGDQLTIESAANHEVIPGDIVLVLRHGRFFIHRLVEVRRVGDRFWWMTKGDAMPDSDPPIVARELLGRVARINRAQCSFVPRRRVSQTRSAMAWIGFRWDRLRNLTLRVRAASLRASSTQAGSLLRGMFAAARGVFSVSPFRIGHP
jgi:hypothetical protein